MLYRDVYGLSEWLIEVPARFCRWVITTVSENLRCCLVGLSRTPSQHSNKEKTGGATYSKDSDRSDGDTEPYCLGSKRVGGHFPEIGLQGDDQIGEGLWNGSTICGV